MQFTYEKEDYEFDFSPFSHNCQWRLKYTNKRFIWQIIAQNKDVIVKCSLCGLKSDMQRLNYESPDGTRPNELMGSGNGIGKLLLYRKNGEQDKELIDTIQIGHLLYISENEKGAGTM